MTASAWVVGVDPGPVPGVAVLYVGDDPGPTGPAIFQCDAGSVPWLVRSLLVGRPTGTRAVLAVERFVVGMRSARSSTPKAGAVTRDMVGALTELGRNQDGVTVVLRCAAEVMTWASDKRLAAARLLDATKGMPHARAAARHALFAAVSDCGLPDPLSTKVRA